MTIEINQNIRTAKIEDSQNLAALAAQSFLGYPFEYVFSAKGVEVALKNGERRYVAIQDNHIIGSAVLGVNQTPMAEVMRVMIDPVLRKSGVATLLTRELALDALKLGKYAWADVRGDQIGMQRAALGSGLRAVSLEQGKHVVYSHQDANGESLGPSRETMVHMTTLPIDEIDLQKQTSQLPNQIRRQLVDNLTSALNPSPKDRELSETILPNASATKLRILNNIMFNQQELDSTININSDILKISDGETEAIVVLPDASAFIIKGDSPRKTLDLLAKIGVQVCTYYCDINDTNMHQTLMNSDMKATSIRPWVNEMTGRNVWQICWRATSNDYKYCLHTISLDPIVERQITKIIKIIE